MRCSGAKHARLITPIANAHEDHDGNQRVVVVAIGVIGLIGAARYSFSSLLIARVAADRVSTAAP